MSKQQATCSIRHSTCWMLQVTCCFHMLPVAIRHVALTCQTLLWHVERCFDMLLVAVRQVASTCCWCGRGFTSHLSPQRGLKTQNSHFPCKIALRFNKVCCIVSLCENFHWQSCTAFTGISIRVKMNGVGCFLKRKFYISWTTPWCGSRTD